MSIDAIGVPGQPLNTPPLTVWQAAVRDAIHAVEADLATDKWTAWTPTYTNLTVSAADARFRRTPGGMVDIDVHLTIATVTGHSSFSLPYAAQKRVMAACGLEDVSASAVHLGIAIYAGPIVYVQSIGANGLRTNLSASSPFTWAAGDLIHLTGSYSATPDP